MYDHLGRKEWTVDSELAHILLPDLDVYSPPCLPSFFHTLVCKRSNGCLLRVPKDEGERELFLVRGENQTPVTRLKGKPSAIRLIILGHHGLKLVDVLLSDDRVFIVKYLS